MVAHGARHAPCGVMFPSALAWPNRWMVSAPQPRCKLLCRQQSDTFLRVMRGPDAKLTAKLGAAVDFVAWRDGAGRSAWQATLARVDAPLPPAEEPPAT